MTQNSRTFDFVEKEIRQNTFGIFSTVSPKGKAHSTGILYGVSPLEFKFSLYLITLKDYVKVRNIMNNPYISLVIPFPHYYLRFIPSSCVYFQGTAKIVSFDSPEPQKAFNQKRILKMMLEKSNQPEMKEKSVFIKIKPNKKIFCYGLGLSIWQLLREHEKGEYSVIIPLERR
ncbi:MAG: pyridoxamine 5'-phosphate oxidase family protein [Candidatus Hodarchaeales archaeon]|jgi:general stress protein 26